MGADQGIEFARQAIMLLVFLSLPVLVTGLIAGCDTNPVSSTQYDYSDSDVLSFAVGDSVTISADTFVGSVTFGPWVLEGVQVTITKWANVEADLDLLHVESSESDTVVRVEASNPENLNEVEVDIEILGPPGVSLDLASGQRTLGLARKNPDGHKKAKPQLSRTMGRLKHG